MLTKIRDSSKSLAFYVLGGIVVAVLIISFGTPSISKMAGATSGSGAALAVGDGKVSGDEFRQTLLLAGAGNMPVEQAKQFRLRERVMDDLIERELLLAEARRLGLGVSADEAEDFVVHSQMLLFGQTQPLSGVQKDGAFDFDRFRRFLQFYGMSTRSFMDLQRRELTALRMREMLAGTVGVSMAQVQERYVQQGNQVNLEYLRYPVRRYEDDLDPTAQDVSAYVAANADKVKAEFEKRKFQFEK